jgi:hypothetical protein
MNKKYNFYAEGGSLGNHGLKYGDQIIKTMSGGVQKIKTKTGDIVYVNLANGYRGAEPPLPFAKGGGVRKVGNREYSTGRNWTNDHRHVNKSEQHEVNYNRRNSLFFAGGGEIRRFDRQAQMDSETREEILDVLSESDTPKVLTNYLYGLFDGYDYSETANFKKEVEFLKRKNPKLHQRVVDIYKKIDKYKFEKYQDNYANGGDFQTVVYAKRGALLSAKERYILELKGLTGLTKEGVEKYISDNGLTEDEVLNIVIGLGRKQIQRMDVVTAMTGKKNNAESKRLIRFAKSDKALKLADGGQLEIKFTDGGSITDVTSAIFFPNQKNGKIKTSFGDKTKEGLFAMISNVNYYPEEISKAVFEPNEKNEKIKTSFGDKTLIGLTEIIKNVRNTFSDGGGVDKKNSVYFKPTILESEYPNFLTIVVKYPVGDGFLTALGQKTSSGQERDNGQIKANQISKSIVAKLNKEFNIEDIDVSDNKNGKVVIFAVSDDFVSLTKNTIEQKIKNNSYATGGKTTFKQKATAIAKNFEGKKVEPKYQKEYGKTYDKAEAKEVGNKIAGSQKAKYDSKMTKGGSVKKSGSAMVYAKKIRKDGESWRDALIRANKEMKKQ